MKQLTCEMCGGTDLVKQDGVFVCQSCGSKYSIEEAKKMMVEGTVEVTGVVEVDNTAAIKNYLTMAKNALDAKNYSEAEEYCNKIIELDVENWEAWFIKGRAVGWQSTLGNIRTAESVNAFSKAMHTCPKECRQQLGEDCLEALNALHAALLSLRVECFKTHPNDRDVKALMEDGGNIVSQRAELLADIALLTDIALLDVATKESTPPEYVHYGVIISNGIVEAWMSVYGDYRSGDGYPSDYAFRQFISEGDALIKGLQTSFLFWGSDYDDPKVNKTIINAYEILISFQEKIRDARSYKVSFYGGSSFHETSLEFTAEAKRLRNEQIRNWKEKIQEVKTATENIEKRQAQERFEKYWSEHAEEKADLEQEKASLNQLVKEAKAQFEAIPEHATAKELTSKINALNAERKGLGLFKSKERKALQEQIDALSTELSSVQERIRKAKDETVRKTDSWQIRIQKIDVVLSSVPQ